VASGILPLIATPSFDIWSFGIILYLLVTGGPLFKNNQEDDLGDEELHELLNWNHETLTKALNKVHSQLTPPRPLARDLLQKLLQPSAAERLKGLDDVLYHPFFVGDCSDQSPQQQTKIDAILKNQEFIRKQLDRHKKMLVTIETNTINIGHASDMLLLQLIKAEQVLLRAVFEATEVKAPTAFFITPSKLGENTSMLIELSADGTGIELTAGGQQLQEEFDKRKGWFNNIRRLGSNVRDAVSGRGPNGLILQAQQEVEAFVREKLEDQPMYLYLIDEYTGEPVVPDEEQESCYPIKIITPSETAMKLLPIMRMGLNLMSLVNGAAMIGHMFGAPIPNIPEAWHKKASDAVESLDKKSSVEEFDVLQQSLDAGVGGAANDGSTKQDIRGAALREYEHFLDKHDPHHTFAGLNRAVTSEGQACWTVLTRDELVQAEEAKRSVDVDGKTEQPQQSVRID
jgi:hypothetical protein